MIWANVIGGLIYNLRLTACQFQIKENKVLWQTVRIQCILSSRKVCKPQPLTQWNCTVKWFYIKIGRERYIIKQTIEKWGWKVLYTIFCFSSQSITLLHSTVLQHTTKNMISLFAKSITKIPVHCSLKFEGYPGLFVFKYYLGCFSLNLATGDRVAILSLPGAGTVIVVLSPLS